MYTHEEITFIVAKQLSGHASPQELEQLQNWIAAGNRQEYEQLVKIWEQSEQAVDAKAFDTSAAWAKIDAAIAELQRNTAIAPQPPIVRFSYIKRIAVAASVLAIAAIGWYIWQNNHTQWKNVTAVNGNESLHLPDGSTILLRKGSTLSYPIAFDKDLRTVKLTGEAFFQVQHNEKQPFIANTPNAAIKVLGTSFMINSTASQDEVVVITGKVSITEKSNTGAETIVDAGQKVVLQNDQFIKSTLANANDIAWQTGLLDFNNTPLVKVLEDASHYYEIPLGLAPDQESQTGNLPVTVRFDNQPLEEVLEELRLITGLQTKKENGKVVFYQK